MTSLRSLVFPSATPSMVAFCPYLLSPHGPRLSAANTLTSQAQREWKAAARSTSHAPFIRKVHGTGKVHRTGKTVPVLVDFPLHLISQDCHTASPNCKGGRELKYLERGEVLAHDWPKPPGGHITAWPRRGDSCRVGEAARGIV